MEKNYWIFPDFRYSFTFIRQRRLKELTRMIDLLKLGACSCENWELTTCRLLLDWTPSFAGPARCYCQIKNKPYQKSRYCRGMPHPKIRIYDVGIKKKRVDEFPFVCIWLVGKKRVFLVRHLKLLLLHATSTWRSLLDAFHLKVRVHPFHVLCVNKMLSCAGADRIHTSMRGAFGKPQGTCAHVAIGQVLLSVCCNDSKYHNAQKALRHAKFKFPSHQKIIVNRK